MSQLQNIKRGCDEVKSQIEDVKNITYNDIAAKLIQDKLLLTALELHTELMEAGKELRQLKDFFSNPSNFEHQIQEVSLHLSRSGSEVTLDSLDFTRNSEDGGGPDEKIAVLEFELRKAKETISALRNNLTVATESETNSPCKSNFGNLNVGSIKPHEQRALNYLINEYLLLHGFKLTSITFADENQNQDFDDWDDVGLNISKPPELLTLYREGLKQTGVNTHSVSVQTEKNDNNIDYLKEKLNTLENENSKLSYANVKLKEEIKKLSSQLVMTSENTSEIQQTDNKSVETEHKNSFGSDSPERFEIIDKNMTFKKRDSIVFLEDNISNNSFNASDWMSLNIPTEDRTENSCKNTDLLSKSPFIKEIFSKCYKQEKEICMDESFNNEYYIHTVTLSLQKIIPNIILNKREEVIQLLISTILLNPKASERDKLLQQLFNLKKKPSEVERSMILGGLIGIAKSSGENLVENELLPQCWLQLTHKYVERRLLVAEACIALMPYVSNSIRNSLCLSMLQQMLEDKDDAVRETIVKALSILVALCGDPDKYSACEQLAFNTINDTSNGVINLSTQVLFPVLGKWSLNQGLLSSSLLRKLLNKLNHYIKDKEGAQKVGQSSDKILRTISVIENLLPFLFISVASHENVISNIEKDMVMEIRPEFRNVCSSLTNPEIFYEGDVNPGMIIYEFDKFILENPHVSWPEMDWFMDIMLPDLFNNLHHIDISQQALLQSFITLFSHICIVFGKNFTYQKIRPLLETKICNLEQVVSSFNQFCPSLNIIPIYLTVLSYSGDSEELSNVLKKFLTVLPLCGSSLDCLEIAVRHLCNAGLKDVVVESLWSGVMHQRPLIRAASASLFSGIIGSCDVELLKSKVTPALVTLASDNDGLVRTAAIPALGSLITDCSIQEIHDKVYLQLQTYLSEAGLKENHILLRQIIVTLGNIVNSCTTNFRNEVILPQLLNMSAFMLQMKNQTRKVDMAQALLEAYTNVVYSPLKKKYIGTSVLPGLRHLETVILENQALNTHWETLTSMIRECDNNQYETSNSSSLGDLNTKLSQNVNQGVEEVRQRMSKIFNKTNIPKPNTVPNIQGIFKKK